MALDPKKWEAMKPKPKAKPQAKRKPRKKKDT